MKDDLGERMKGYYEDATRYRLPRRTYTIIRLDGKAFHTFQKSAWRTQKETPMFTAEYLRSIIPEGI